MAIATLIAAGRLDERLLDAALSRLEGGSLFRWVEKGDAADVETVLEPAAIRGAIEGWEGLDVIPQPAGPRLKRLLVADMDSTMIGQECIDELADYAGVKTKVAEITERAMQGELDFEAALAERVALLTGLEERVIDLCLAERIRPSPGAKRLVRTMRTKGARAILVSGGFTAFVAPVAREIGFDAFEANVLGAEGGRLSGRTAGPIVDSARKAAVLAEASEELGLDAGETMAIGDGANDMALIAAAGLGIAYRAKPRLAEVADARLDHHGLDALLYALGIPRADWVEA